MFFGSCSFLGVLFSADPPRAQPSTLSHMDLPQSGPGSHAGMIADAQLVRGPGA